MIVIGILSIVSHNYCIRTEEFGNDDKDRLTKDYGNDDKDRLEPT